MPQPPQFFTSLAGVPVRYDRAPLSQYGTRGVPFRFHSRPDFTDKIEACFDELWRVCPLGRAEVITSAGAYTNKPGQHGQGRAFDLDGIFWANKTFVTLHDGFNARDRAFYFGVECVIRKHFGQVLNYLYNADHRDHFHFDDAVAVGFRQGSRATVGFLQGTLRFVHGIPLATDGRWGPITRDATRRALQELGISGFIDDRPVWLSFLSRSAARAFGTAAPVPAGPAFDTRIAAGGLAAAPALLAAGTAFEGRTPERLLHAVYEVLRRELGDTALRKPVESALDQFANHPETVAWLAGQQAGGGGGVGEISPADLRAIRLSPANGAAVPVLDPLGGDGDFGL